ncbi:MAG TPA: glycosyltransferase family 2 protein [Streptomyces sp.]|uniref:glycosyltransferase family 2 protein n=1 Tax=Streptomyces sp. TaxID=1931 RepID=UPI002D50E017|nr:glycosyltransferase family 2 protein [Streptomyces sp.]HZG02564.1 glycosyltransferase family 2 protein [Streptomyces sp.]
MVKLSVIVPFHNVRPYASDALRSLRANAGDSGGSGTTGPPEIEFVLVDDCSTDGTQDLLERAEKEIPGAVLVRHGRRRGVAAARNTGLDAARGEFLAFLDGDDWVAPGHYRDLLAAAEALGCDFLRTDHVRCTGRRRTVVRVPHGRRGTVLDPRDAILPAHRTTSVDYAYAWAGVYHRRLLERGLLRFDEELRTAEDRPWIWRLHREAASFAVVGLTGVFYRRGVATSLTRIGDERQLDFIRAYDRLVEETSRDPDAAALLPKAVRTYCAVIHHHLTSDRFEPHVAKAVRARCAAALRRLPGDLVREALDSMDAERSARLRRLRRRPVLSPGLRAKTTPEAAR